MNHVKKQEEVTHGNKLMLAGHRTDVRTLCISSDNTAILSGSAETVKIWNRYNVGWLWYLMPLSTIFQLYRGGL